MVVEVGSRGGKKRGRVERGKEGGITVAGLDGVLCERFMQREEKSGLAISLSQSNGSSVLPRRI